MERSFICSLCAAKTCDCGQEGIEASAAARSPDTACMSLLYSIVWTLHVRAPARRFFTGGLELDNNGQQVAPGLLSTSQ